jgi:hypothetical protein
MYHPGTVLELKCNPEVRGTVVKVLYRGFRVRYDGSRVKVKGGVTRKVGGGLFDYHDYQSETFRVINPSGRK